MPVVPLMEGFFLFEIGALERFDLPHYYYPRCEDSGFYDGMKPRTIARQICWECAACIKKIHLSELVREFDRRFFLGRVPFREQLIIIYHVAKGIPASDVAEFTETHAATADRREGGKI